MDSTLEKLDASSQKENIKLSNAKIITNVAKNIEMPGVKVLYPVLHSHQKSQHAKNQVIMEETKLPRIEIDDTADQLASVENIEADSNLNKAWNQL